MIPIGSSHSQARLAAQSSSLLVCCRKLACFLIRRTWVWQPDHRHLLSRSCSQGHGPQLAADCFRGCGCGCRRMLQLPAVCRHGVGRLGQGAGWLRRLVQVTYVAEVIKDVLEAVGRLMRVLRRGRLHEGQRTKSFSVTVFDQLTSTGKHRQGVDCCCRGLHLWRGLAASPFAASQGTEK